MNSQNQQPPLNLSDPQLQARLALLAAQQQNLQDRQPVSQDHIAAMAAAVGSMQGQNREAIISRQATSPTVHGRSSRPTAASTPELTSTPRKARRSADSQPAAPARTQRPIACKPTGRICTIADYRALPLQPPPSR